MTDTIELASYIADKLLTNGFGEKADRLVLMTNDGKNLGGRCKASIRDVIRDAILAAMPEEK